MTRIGLRNAWFQVHKWIGLILAVLIIPISVTGSALIWHDQIDEWMHPARHGGHGPAVLAPAAYADAARGALAGGERLSRLDIPAKPGEPVIATANRPGRGRPVRLSLYLDPSDAHVIEKVNGGEGLFPVIHVLHGSLMWPGAGRLIVGWVGVAMLLSSLTGLWLWWPVTSSVRRGFRWKRHPNFDTNLHHQLGFWISVPLFVLSLTGVWISFPPVFAGFDGPQPPRGPGPDRAALMRAQPLATPAISLEVAVARAVAAAPGKPVLIGWPTDLNPEWTVSVAPEKGRPASVTVADKDGTAKVAPAPAGPPRQTLARTMRQIHDGSDLPFVWQLILFLGGLLPAILAVTGIIMWWRARTWRGALAERKRAAAARAAG
ncbi:PepSY domain-containing protein [Sphingomonas sp. LB-2]|uniref:PepSY-associated TM helix domain-containing protein n=1 Tax=Sphingomonas caeni TaxID=2984949 RepID=UPI00223134A2|nr:PepSY-associated TM helix domain-containing protein [Sphingomonas caeni]MCW3848164.1 PepSY domain-containing protein [Sphingomonas caeni]